MIGIGELGSLGAALMWAISSLIFGRTRLSAWSINFSKNTVGTIWVLLSLILISLFTGADFLNIPLQDIGYLAISGLIGLTIGDTFYFRSLQILGPRRSLVMATTTPIFGALLGWAILEESVTWMTMSGILICVTGISAVILDRRASHEAPGIFPGRLRTGVLLGLVAALCQAAGGAISKIGMDHCTALEATFFRLLVAVVGAIIAMLAGRQLQSTFRAIAQRDILKKVIPAATIGTFLGVWFSQAGFKYTTLAIATTLLSTSPLFAIPLVRIVNGHRVSVWAIVGNVVAIVGIILVVTGDWEQMLELFSGGSGNPVTKPN